MLFTEIPDTFPTSETGSSGAKNPQKAGILNTDTGELRRFIANPTEVTVALEAQWNEIVGMGADFEHLHYHHTTSPVITFDVTYSRIVFAFSRMADRFGATGRADMEETREEFDKHRRFLISLLYPRGNINDVQRRSPPYVIFLWPNFLALRGVFKSLTMKHSQFATTGEPIEFTASVTVKEARSYRLTSADAYRVGFLRESAR
jgi:hypothetical protein